MFQKYVKFDLINKPSFNIFIIHISYDIISHY